MVLKQFQQCFIQHRKSIFSFLTVGAIAAVINFLTFSFFWGFLKINYQIAVSIAYVLSVVFHFNANRYFTFKSHAMNFIHQIKKYLVMVGVNYVVTLLVVHHVVAVLSLSPYIGSMAAILMTVGSGYLMSKFWVFSTDKKIVVFRGD